MNSKPHDSPNLLAANEGSENAEAIVPVAGESRSERIRRLNRERQRRRREKIKMSRHNEATSASSNGSGSDNLQFQADADHFEGTVKVELEVPVEQIQEDSALIQPKKQTRRRQPAKDDEASFEQSSALPAPSTANNAILPPCHDNNSKFNASNDAPDLSAVPLVASEVEVIEEKPQENGAEAFTDALAVPTTSTKRRTRDSNRKRAEKLTVVSIEEPEPKRDSYRDRDRKKRQSMTQDEVTARREKQRELKRKQKERMTSDQVEALRARYREWRRKRKETMTSDQLEVIRRGNRERQRRRRERLGIKKRQGAPQTKGVSEAVIQGLKNKQAHGSVGQMKPTEANLTDPASLVQAVNVVMNPENPTAAPVIMSTQRVDQSIAHVTSNATSVTGMQTITPASSVAPPTTVAAEVSTLPSVPLIGAQGPFLPNMAGSPMQGALFHGMAGIPGAFLSTTANSVSVSQAGLQNTILPAVNAQGAFLPGITPGAPISGLTGVHGFAGVPAQIGKDGQILHSISTLLPIAPMQGTGQGVTFLAPFSATGQIQGFQDARHSLASSVRSVTPIAAAQAVAAAVESTPQSGTATAAGTVTVTGECQVAAPDDKSEVLPQKKTKSRGRKRATSAAEMLVNLSNLPPTHTPMASMLSAMASAHESQTSPNQTAAAGSQVAEKSPGEGPPTKRPAQVSDMASDAATLQPVQANVGPAPTASMQFPPGDPAGATMSSLPTQGGPAKIPHMSTFLTAMGGGSLSNMPFVTTGYTGCTHNAVNPNQFYGHYVPASRVSVAVETDEIRRQHVGTNTVRESHSAADDLDMVSIGTMTDSLYKVSVGTGTTVVKQDPLLTENSQRFQNATALTSEKASTLAKPGSDDDDAQVDTPNNTHTAWWILHWEQQVLWGIVLLFLLLHPPGNTAWNINCSHNVIQYVSHAVQ